MPASVQWSRPMRRGTDPADGHIRHDMPIVAEIDTLQRSAFQLPGWPEMPHSDGAMRWVAATHHYNSQLWDPCLCGVKGTGAANAPGRMRA